MLSVAIPSPLHVLPRTGPGFRPGQPAEIVAPDQASRPLAERYARELEADTGLAFPVRVGQPTGRAIVLELGGDDAELAKLPAALGISPHGGDPAAERYGIDVTADAVRVWASAQEGLFRGLTTLRQLTAEAIMSGRARATGQARAPGAGEISAQRIADGPRFAWRGLSFDVARTFFTVEQVKQVIDILAAYKLNVLHLHLTDDTGWRLDVPGKPKLARVGGQHAVGDRPGGWYSQADFAALVRYGMDRFVTVIPEIDMPGHATALLRAYPELTSDGTPPERVAGGGVFMAALDLDIDGTVAFVDDLLAQVAALSPAPFLHIGGDETLGLPEVAFRRFTDHAMATVRGLGKRVIGWQEISRAGIGPGDVVQYWFDRADELATLFPPAYGQDLARAVQAGAQVLVSPSRYAYLDVGYAEPSADPGQEDRRQRVGLPFYPRASVRDALAWDPETLVSDTAQKKDLAGVEAALWCETVEDVTDAHFLLLPRLPGIAEKAWSPRPTAWDEYRTRLAAHGRLWQRRRWGFFRSSLVDWAPA